MKEPVSAVEPKAFTMKTMAIAYGISIGSVKAAIKSGRLPARRLGTHRVLIDIDEAEKWFRKLKRWEPPRRGETAV